MSFKESVFPVCVAECDSSSAERRDETPTEPGAGGPHQLGSVASEPKLEKSAGPYLLQSAAFPQDDSAINGNSPAIKPAFFFFFSFRNL